MGLFSRRKSSVQSFGSRPSRENHQYYDKAHQLHPLPGEEGFLFNLPPPTPLSDGTARTNNSMDLKPPPSRRLPKPIRPTTAQSDLSFYPPKLTPKTTKQNERPPSAASRVFFNNGQPISSTGKSIAPRSRLGEGNTVFLANDISAINLRPSASVQSLKVKSLDLLKSNPRLKYIIPDTPPPPPSRSNELQFRHDGRGLFAAKTVANLADELDTSGLRKLLDRDTRRYQSSYDLRKQYYRPSNMREQIPQSRGNTVSTDDYESYAYPSERAYNPFPDLGPFSIRPVFGSSDRSDSMDSQRFESAQSYRIPEESQPREKQPQLIDHSDAKSNLPSIVLSGKDQKEETNVDQPPPISKEKSPIIILSPNSSKSTETQSTLPGSPIHIHSQPTASDLRPPSLTFPTETASSSDAECKAEKVGSETPRDFFHFDNEERNDYPVIPRDDKDFISKVSNQRRFEHHAWLTDLNTGPSDTESSIAIEFDEEEDDHHHPIFHPYTPWRGSPITGTSILSPSRTDSPASPGSRGSPVESEGSWLSGRMEIEKAALKSFHPTSPHQTPPLLLESSTLPQATGHSPLKIDTILAAAAMNVRAWSSTNKPLYRGEENGISVDELEGMRERVRQVSAARRVQVVDSPNVEGIVGRVSWESVERDFHQDRDGEIVLV